MRHEPIKVKCHIRVFFENRREKLAAAATREFAEPVIFQLPGHAGELKGVAVVFGVDVKSLQVSLLGNPGDRAHTFGKPRPLGVVRPGDTGARSGEGT